MVDFTISLAGIPIGVSGIYPSTLSLCKDYLTDELPAFTVVMTQEAICAERSFSARQDELAGIAPRRFSDSYLESLALYRAIAERLIGYDIVVFHGSALVVEGEAFVFTAPSGTGKTTHTRLWLDQIPGAYVLNGDKPLLRFDSDRILVCGTPWQGKENYGCNEILPLRAVCILERSSENTIMKITLSEALESLLRQTYTPKNELLKALRLINKFSTANLYRLGCNMEPEAAWVSYRGMTF